MPEFLQEADNHTQAEDGQNGQADRDGFDQGDDRDHQHGGDAAGDQDLFEPIVIEAAELCLQFGYQGLDPGFVACGFLSASSPRLSLPGLITAAGFGGLGGL